MSKTNLTHRISLAALACALATPATSTYAHEFDPAATTTIRPADIASDPSGEIVAEPVTPAPSGTIVDESTSIAAIEAAPASTSKKGLNQTAKASTKAAPPATQPETSSTPESLAVPSIEPEVIPAPPVEEVADAQAMPAVPPATRSSSSDEVAFGGILALLALGAGALGFARRRRTTADHSELNIGAAGPAVTPIQREVDFVPASVTPPRPERSAFSWRATAPAATALSPTEKAHRGPSPDNPSMSLKKRLKRAAFFEQRERDAAAGRAVSVSRYAGLPTRMVDAARSAFASPKRELQPA